MFKGAFLFAVAAAALAQSQEPARSPAPSFDAASIRPAAPNNREGGGGRGAVRLPFGRQNIQVTPDSVIARFASLQDIIAWAWGAKDFQVSGPDWLGTQRFDIVAKAASQASEDQLRLMMEALLQDRFKLALHKTTKETQAFVLVIGKGGSKLVQSATQGDSEVTPDQSKMQVTILRTPLSQLTDLLYNVLRAPVVDETGLTGKYDLNINVAKYVAMGSDGPVDPIGIIQTALQEEMGLKLESRKVDLDMLIVDRIEKSAGEN
jgi:uncharacterized protein (TIGR03435 family)